MVKLCTKKFGSRPEGYRPLLPTIPNEELSRFLSGFWATAYIKYSSGLERSQGGF
jgi:hypothetical protein